MSSTPDSGVSDVGLLIGKGSLAFTSALAMDTNGEIDAAANETLALKGGVTGADTLSVGGPGTVQLGGELAVGGTVAAISSTSGSATGAGTVQLLPTFSGSATLIVNGGMLLSNASNMFKGSIQLQSGTIKAGANGGLGTANLLVATAAASDTGRPAAFLDGTATLNNFLQMNTVSSGVSAGPLGVASGSQLVFTNLVTFGTLGKIEIDLDGSPTGTKLTLKGTLNGVNELDVGGGDNSEVELDGAILCTVRPCLGERWSWARSLSTEVIMQTSWLLREARSSSIPPWEGRSPSSLRRRRERSGALLPWPPLQASPLLHLVTSTLPFRDSHPIAKRKWPLRCRRAIMTFPSSDRCLTPRLTAIPLP